MKTLALVLTTMILTTGCGSKSTTSSYNSAETQRIVSNAHALAFKDDRGFVLVPPGKEMFCAWSIHSGSGWFRRGNEDLQFIEEPCATTKLTVTRGVSDSTHEFAMAELMRRSKVAACNAKILSTRDGAKLLFRQGSSSVAQAKWLTDTSYRSMTIELGRKRPDGSREAMADIEMSWSFNDKYYANTKHHARGTCEFAP